MFCQIDPYSLVVKHLQKIWINVLSQVSEGVDFELANPLTANSQKLTDTLESERFRPANTKS